MRVLFIDDTREFRPRAGDRVTTCRTSAYALAVLSDPTESFDEIWLDFDMGGVYGQVELFDTAMPVALWLAEQAFYGRPYNVGQVMVHTGNPVGRQAMGLLLRKYGYDVVDVEPGWVGA